MWWALDQTAVFFWTVYFIQNPAVPFEREAYFLFLFAVSGLAAWLATWLLKHPD